MPFRIKLLLEYLGGSLRDAFNGVSANVKDARARFGGAKARREISTARGRSLALWRSFRELKQTRDRAADAQLYAAAEVLVTPKKRH